MKKIISILVVAVMLMQTCYAQGVILLTKEEDRLIYKGEEDSKYMLAAYLDGVLKEAHVMQNDDGTFWAPDPGREYELRLCNVTKDVTYSADLEVPTPTPPPVEEEKDDEQVYNPNNFPKETYDRAIDAYYAFSVINKVATVLSEDGVICYEVEYANQGKIKTELIDEDVKIISSPTSEPYIAGLGANALKQGDVVYFNREISGTIKDIALIMRAPAGNIMTDENSYGDDFEYLISNGGAVAGHSPWTVASYGSEVRDGKGVTEYAFGMSAYKTGNILYLLNKECNLDTALEIVLKDKTAVYVCDKRSKVGGVEIGSISAIGSNISRKQFMTGGTISPEEEGLSYVLVRLVDGLATDIVYFKY